MLRARTRVVRDRARLLCSWLLLGLSRLLINVAPFSFIRRLLGDGANTTSQPLQLGDVAASRARRIGRLVHYASLRTPWTSDCYPQALAARAQLVLGRIPHTVSFGLRREEDGTLVAHAWVTAGDMMVTGGEHHNYTEVGSFSWVPRSHSPRRAADDQVRLLRADAAQRDLAS